MIKTAFFPIVLSAVLVLTAISASAQTTAFNYQGSLSTAGLPANGSFDLEFALFDSVAAGSQLGSTITQNGITVTDGVFSTSLDFGDQFPGAARFLEIRVRQTGGGGFTTLTPRQPVTSTPYAIKSVTADDATTAALADNALQLGGVAANQYVVTTDPRMTDARPPTPGSASYIQNQNAGAQTASNFNISGNGTAGGILSGNIVNSATQYNIGGVRVLSTAGNNNLFVGPGAGEANTSSFNAFFGTNAGQSNTTGGGNAFFGRSAGRANTTGNFNAFFGADAGFANTTGGENAFFGMGAGFANTTGTSNAFFGRSAGRLTTTGGSNAFFGFQSGRANTTGTNNTIIGRDADVGSGNLSFATAIGASAVVTASNTVVLGRTTDTVSAPGSLIVGNSLVKRGDVNLYSNAGNMDLYMQAAGATTGVNFGVSSDPTMFIAHYDGITYQNRIILTPIGTVRIMVLGEAGANALCQNGAQELATCSSSLRYKTNFSQFRPGMAFVKQLRPISFDWKDGGMKDVGFGAEDIAKIDARFVTYNEKGEVEGVKYDRLSVAFVNAFKEQQEEISGLRSVVSGQQNQIEAQAAEIKRQKEDIEALRALVCSGNKKAPVCRK